MNSTWKTPLVFTLALFTAALLQMTVAHALQIRQAQPDFLLLLLATGSFFCDANPAALLGFGTGTAAASLAAPPAAGFASIVVSRVITGFALGWLAKNLYRDLPLLVPPVAAIGTALASCLFFVFFPQKQVTHWAVNMAGASLYNALLSLPLYFLLSRLLGRPDSS